MNPQVACRTLDSKGIGHRKRGPNRLDARRRRLLQGISQGMTIAEAGKLAGYAHRQAAHRAFRSIQVHLPEALENAGYSVDNVLTEIYQNLRAQMMEATKIRFFKYKGVVREIREVPAHKVQLRAAVALCRLLGLFS
jgi:AraC-like DNA-binding protein